jgi:hypothetical protein
MNIIGENIYADDFKPLPEDLQGWNSQHPIFEQLIREVKPKTIVEVGTWKGASAIQMGLLCKANNLNTKIYCVDTWLGSVEFWTEFADTPERDLMLRNGYPQIYYQFLSNVVHNNLQDVIIPIPNTSANAAKILAYHKIKADLIYVDASHEYDDVKADILMYRPLLNEGGAMMGDDYGWKGVHDAVQLCFLSDLRWPIVVVDKNYWIYKK